MKTLHDEIKEILNGKYVIDVKCYLIKCYLIFKLIGRVKNQPQKVDAAKIESYIAIGKQVGMVNTENNTWVLGNDSFLLTEEGFKRKK
jgi:hypothetical protein